MTHAPSTKVVTAAEMRHLEAQAVAAGGSWRGLMEQAGAGIAEIALRLLRDADRHRAAVLVLVGPGNNGGDGLVVADHLAAAGVAVTVYVWRREPDQEDWPWQAVQRRRVPVFWSADDPRFGRLRELAANAALVVDGILGSGVSRELPADLVALIEVVNQDARGEVLAIDLPTGVDADTGTIHGTAIHAGVTVATGLLKRGHVAGAGRMAAGTLEVAPLALTDDVEEIVTEQLTAATVRALLPMRPGDANKGTFGKVLVIAGSLRYPGAAFLTASGALRSGAGLITLGVGRSVYGPLAASVHEATFLPLPEEDPGVLGAGAATEILSNLEGYAAMVVGPGLGQEDDTLAFMRRLLKIEAIKNAGGVGFNRPQPARDRAVPGGLGFQRAGVGAIAPAPAPKAKADPEAAVLPSLVLDADALNNLAKIEDWHTHLQPGTAVLTPHPGEMARLLQVEDAGTINQDRIGYAQRAAEKWGQVVVLKGANTVIAAPEGATSIDPDGNPALATAGTGDVLAGLIAGLIGQGVTPFAAAQLGVWLHAAAGQRVRDEMGDTGVVAGDLIPRLPLVFRALRG